MYVAGLQCIPTICWTNCNYMMFLNGIKITIPPIIWGKRLQNNDKIRTIISRYIFSKVLYSSITHTFQLQRILPNMAAISAQAWTPLGPHHYSTSLQKPVPFNEQMIKKKKNPIRSFCQCPVIPNHPHIKMPTKMYRDLSLKRKMGY